VPDSRVLSQEEIDSEFRKVRDPAREDEPVAKSVAYDFRRTERIPKDQLRALHQLHENFARNMASSLSAYLRAYVVMNLVSVEQLPFAEFAQGLPSPTVMIALGMKPYDGNAILEINPSLVFPILEMLLGGPGKMIAEIRREITEIEQSILDGLLYIILRDLRNAWLSVAAIEFSIERHETDPQLTQVVAATEPVVAISIEARIGDTTGMMSIGIPSIVVKMLRQKFDQQRGSRKTHSTEEEHARVFRMLQPAALHLDARLQGPALGVETLLELKEHDILVFDYPVSKPVDLMVNGKVKYHGEVVLTGRKRALQIQDVRGAE
jgi:flagellar motor switch protein FliM